MCCTTPFYSFLAAWSEVQAIDDEIMQVAGQVVDEKVAKIADVSGSQSFLIFPESKALDEVLESLGIDESWKDDYDFDDLLKQALDAIKQEAAPNDEKADMSAADIENSRGASVTRKHVL